MRAARRKVRADAVATPQGWSELLAQAQACCRDAQRETTDATDDRDCELRRFGLTHAVRDAQTGLFQASGYPTFQFANGFLELARAFASARHLEHRRAMAAGVSAAAAFLDQQLHAERQRAFEAAHRNRPEIYG